MDKEIKKQMSAGVILSYLIIVVNVLTGLLYTPIVLRSLGQSQYGVYSLCVSFMGYLTIMNAGVNAAYIRFYVQTKVSDEKRIPALNGLFLRVFLALAVVALLGGWIVGYYSPSIFGNKISSDEYDLIKQCFRFLSINSAVQVINCVFSSIIIANERFVFGKGINLLAAIANPIIVTPFLLNGYSCIIIIVVHMIMAILTLCINYVYCIKSIHISFDIRKHDVVLLRDIVLFSGFIVLQSIMDQLNWQIDKFILARMRGTEDISLYSVGTTFNTYYITLSGAVTGVFIAQINKLHASNKKGELSDLFIKSSRVLSYLMLLIMSAYVFFGKQFVICWAGKAYESSYYVGVLLMTPITLALIMGLGQDIARAKNRHQLQIVINIIVCIINTIISIPLAALWGAIGSALGTFIAEIIICCVIQPVYYKQVLELDMARFFNELLSIVPGLIIPSILGAVIVWFRVLKPNYLSLAIWGGVYCAVYVGAIWIIAMNDEEKEFIRRGIRKVIRSMREYR